MESKLLIGLNTSQQAAVQCIEGPLLILAGPGSGKTRVITHRIAYMIEQGIAPHNIVALTFTNKAAGEMRARLERLVGHNDVWMGTFHSFCARMLRRYARLVGLPENFSIYDSDDAQKALKSAIDAANFSLTHITLGALSNRISYFKNRLVTPEILEGEALSSREHQVARVYPHYQAQLLRSGAVDFDDLLMHTATLLRTHPEIREQWDARLRYVMVDEYQDTNLAQYVIVRHLCVDYPNLAATGDPDQSIYGWRGANVKNVTNFERDYPGMQVVRLEENYRSTPEILSVADALIQNNEFRKPKTLIPSRSSGHTVRLHVYSTARQEAEDIADQIVALVRHGEYSYRDFGVLYRTNAHSRLLEQAMARRQIPFQLIGGFRFYLRKEIKDLVAYLLLVHNPQDNLALLRAINTPTRGVGKQTIGKLEALAARHGVTLLEGCRIALESGELNKRALSGVRTFLKIYDQLSSLAHGPLLDLLQMTIELTRYREFLVRQSRDEEHESEVSSNLDELLAEARELDNETDGERSALEAFLEFAVLQAETDRLDTEHDLVTLMTLHAAKGLEFPQVYIIAVEENILPHARSKDDPQGLEEERRLLFVGITRAMDGLQLSYAKSRGFSGMGSGVPSSFLMELPRGEMQICDRTDQFAGYLDSADDWDDPFVDLHSDFADSSSEADEPQLAITNGESIDPGFDDDCQLPPDEIRERLLRAAGARSGRQQLQFGSQIEAAPGARWAAFQEGCTVLHERFGLGTIIAASGHGPKRAVTINFTTDGSRRTFRLSHVKLELQSPE